MSNKWIKASERLSEHRVRVCCKRINELSWFTALYDKSVNQYLERSHNHSVNRIDIDDIMWLEEKEESGISNDEELTHFHIADNSDALHEWLDTKGISYISNGQFTSIGIKEDIFSIGMNFGIYKHNAQKVSKDQELMDKLDSVIVYGHNLSEQQKNKIEEIVMQYFTEKVKSLHNKYDHGEVNNIYNLAIFDVLEILK